MVDINLTGVFFCKQYAFRIMIKQQLRGGRIIKCVPISLHLPKPNSASYYLNQACENILTRSTSLGGRNHYTA